MSRTLSAVLHEYAVKHRAQVEEARELRKEWLGAIRRLLDQCRQWLEEADKEGVLAIREGVELIAEETLGRYEAPALIVTLGPTEVTIRPRRRFVLYPITTKFEKEAVKVEGRAEITDGTLDFSLYRLRGEQGDRWLIDSHTPPVHEILSQETFDRLLAGLLG